MGKCITPFYKKDNPGIPLPCGKCPECCKRRASGWSFRLEKEGENFPLSYFVTLTYDTSHVPITEKGFMSLNKRDVQLFIKRLRKKHNGPLKYYCAGEYGTKYGRPHYHLITFNAQQSHIVEAWTDQQGKAIGSVYFGTVEAASIGYTLKYISKERIIPIHANDDRLPEFSLMSKGLGANYINPKQSPGI